MLSNKVMRALNKHETLSGLFRRNDIVVRALEAESHRGYQAWHRAYDEVVKWLRNSRNQEATPVEFLRFLREFHTQLEMRQRLPYALGQIDALIRRFMK